MEKLKWVDPGKLHVTLRFLGETDPGQLKGIMGMLEETVPTFISPEVRFMGLGLFRSVRDPRVLWIGMDTGPVLPDLKRLLDQQLVRAGFPAENRKFSAHLTLARITSIKDTELLGKLLNQYRNSFFQKNRMDEVVLYESILRPAGPEYRALKKVAFKS